MKLYIVRHAEAEERASGARDFDRVLPGRGIRQASALARHFKDHSGKSPEVIYSSPAPRALQTATIIAAAIETPVTIDPRLDLETDATQVRSLVRSLASDGVKRAMLVGHNPTLEDFAAAIGAGSGLKKAEMIAADVECDARTVVAKRFDRFKPHD